MDPWSRFAPEVAVNESGPGQSTRTIAITGASGLVGRALQHFLAPGGHRLLRLVRSKKATGPDAVYWNPDEGAIDAASLEGVDAVIHLAGENLAEGRWTDERKARFQKSRVLGTRLLAETLARLERKPEVFLSASAIGYYGNTGEARVDETTPAGRGFLAELCVEWENAAAAAKEAGIRVVHPRIGIVLSPDGGALAKMLPVFKLGFGGKLGKGEQYFSWIDIDDLAAALHFLVFERSVVGPVNCVAPSPVTNAEFTKTLAKVLARPAVVPVPSFALKTVFGREMASETLLGGQRVYPKKLLEHDFRWKHPTLEAALRDVLNR